MKKPSQTEKIEPNKKTEKTEPNRKNPSQTGFCSKKPNRTETGRFEPVRFFFKFGLVTFF